MKYKNQLVLTGEIDDVGAPIRENSGQSYRRGLEIESLLNLSNKITINANMSLSENKNLNILKLEQAKSLIENSDFYLEC